MKNKFIWAALSLLIAFTSCHTSKKGIQNNDPSLENALLWEISIDGVEKPSYLFGTIHMIGQEDYFLPQGTLTGIENTEKMVFEIDMASMTDMSNLMGIMGKIFMKDNKTLKDLLSEEDYASVKDHFSDLGLPMMMLDRIKPMFLSAFTFGDMNPGSMQTGEIKSYEMELFSIAQSRNMTSGGLETIDFQISVFDSIPCEDQAQLLMETIKSSNTENDEFKEMVNLYKAQDINAMGSMFSEEESGYADYEDVLLIKRNKAWIPQMIETAKEQPTFFAVGAGHLGGKFGVINLLTQEGVKMKPLSHIK
jgi:uncharacterized protein YbaP (TraB family)